LAAILARKRTGAIGNDDLHDGIVLMTEIISRTERVVGLRRVIGTDDLDRQAHSIDSNELTVEEWLAALDHHLRQIVEARTLCCADDQQFWQGFEVVSDRVGSGASSRSRRFAFLAEGLAGWPCAGLDGAPVIPRLFLELA
jgi:hypothetical protein